MIINIDQTQQHHIFKFPVEFGILINNELKIETLRVNNQSEVFEIDVATKLDDVIIDPEKWLLFEEKSN